MRPDSETGYDFPEQGTTAERFAAFDASNPHIYAELERRALLLLRRGRRHMGIRLLWESMRWDALVHTDAEDFKLNDHYTSFYARKLIADHPELDGVIETRERRARAA